MRAMRMGLRLSEAIAASTQGMLRPSGLHPLRGRGRYQLRTETMLTE